MHIINGVFMEKLKKQVIKLLTEDARYSMAKLSEIIGAPLADVENAVTELERAGAIVKYSAILNTEVISAKSVQALIEVKVAPQKLKGFDSYAEDLYDFDEVKSLYLMSGGFDLAVFVEGETISDIARFVAEKLSVIDGITGVQTHFILKKYKIEGQITKPAEEHKRQIYQA